LFFENERKGANQNNPWLHRFAVLTAIITFLLIGAGGLVTSHEAGMSVPDWPNSYGYNMFALPIKFWHGGAFFEHTHRLLASGAGFLTTILAVWLWLKDYREMDEMARRHRVSARRCAGRARRIARDNAHGFARHLSRRHRAIVFRFDVRHRAVHQPVLERMVRWRKKDFPCHAACGACAGHDNPDFHPIDSRRDDAASARGPGIPDFPLAYGKIWPDTSADAVAHYNADRVEVVAVNPITAFQIELQMVHRMVALAFSFWWRLCAGCRGSGSAEKIR
jgi:heme a synthase